MHKLGDVRKPMSSVFIVGIIDSTCQGIFRHERTVDAVGNHDYSKDVELVCEHIEHALNHVSVDK